MKRISLVVADLDGTLIDPEKRLIDASLRAVREFEDKGGLFTVVSGRPPFGMRSYVDVLRICLPISGFNGGMVTNPDYETTQKLTLPPDVAREASRFLETKGLQYWIYRGSDWMVLKSGSPHEEKETRNVGFSPSVVSSFEGRWVGVTKIVGICDDHEKLAGIAHEMQLTFRGRATAARSQPYYLDITHSEANKGLFIDYLSQLHRVPRDEIAMGNASESVKAAAKAETSSNAEEGFARAMDELVLGRKSQTSRSA